MWTRACIFDLDGVIVDTAKFHFLAWKKLADRIGILFTEKDNERLKGVSRNASLDIILDIGKKDFSRAEKAEMASLKNNWYIEYIRRMSPDDILPGTLKWIRELRENGIRIALGSASKNTPLILERLGLDHFFDAVVDGNTIHSAKPDPEVFIKASALMSIEKERCTVFEDAQAGVEAALNAGMICIGIGEKNVLKDAHMVIRGFFEMNLKKLEVLERKLGYE
jgi:beta-phosphoglucomutase